MKPSILENKMISKYTTIGVGGSCSYFAETSGVNDLINLVKWARSKEISYKVIGMGSNLIFSDKGFSGLVIVNRTGEIRVDINKSQIICDSGVPLSKLILESAANELAGLEQMFGVPGTVGGAIAVNAGSHGVSIGQNINSVSIIDSDGEIKTVKPNWFNFDYRTSKIKDQKKKNPVIILSCVIQMHKKRSEDIMSMIKKYGEIRRANQPIGEKTCGSIFRNPSESDVKTNTRESSAGYLLEQSGAKKMSVDGAKVSKKHANWIINKSNASSADIRTLVDNMRSAVRDKFQVELKEEVEYVGDWS